MKKDWYKSKTIWAVIMTAAYTVSTQVFGVDFPDWVEPTLLAAGLLFSRVSTTQIK